MPIGARVRLAAAVGLWQQSLTVSGISEPKRPHLILASSSPRRRQLLSDAKIAFEAVESGIAEEIVEEESASNFALRMAREKALAVSRSRLQELVLGADTVVECEGQILGKPRDASEACRMLETLSGRTHIVVTAFALARNGEILESAPIVSRVTFRHLSLAEIERYVASGEPMDKAGAYGIQGDSAGFIAAVDGSRDNVMGLPVAEVLAALAKHGIVRRSKAL
jgi:nucleoside triphosphate pyrophosphatase